MENYSYRLLSDEELKKIDGGGRETLAQGIKRVYDSIWPNDTAWYTGKNNKTNIPPYSPYGH